MLENEIRATHATVTLPDDSRFVVKRKNYPFTNKQRLRGHGWSAYEPLDESHALLYALPTQPAISLSDVNEELIKALGRQPALMRELTPRRFEALVAAIFENQGFRVDLTRPTRDGGVDIYAARSDLSGPLLYVIECKRYASTRKVGIEIVQRVYGVASGAGANKGIVVTTSTFTRAALDFARPLSFSLSLRGYDDLVAWLRQFVQPGR